MYVVVEVDVFCVFFLICMFHIHIYTSVVLIHKGPAHTPELVSTLYSPSLLNKYVLYNKYRYSWQINIWGQDQPVSQNKFPQIKCESDTKFTQDICSIGLYTIEKVGWIVHFTFLNT